jgi:hypothetical protein
VFHSLHDFCSQRCRGFIEKDDGNRSIGSGITACEGTLEDYGEVDRAVAQSCRHCGDVPKAAPGVLLMNATRRDWGIDSSREVTFRGSMGHGGDTNHIQTRSFPPRFVVYTVSYSFRYIYNVLHHLSGNFTLFPDIALK